MAKNWKKNDKAAEKALKAIQDWIPALKERDEVNQKSTYPEYEDIKTKDVTTNVYEKIRTILDRKWGPQDV